MTVDSILNATVLTPEGACCAHREWVIRRGLSSHTPNCARHDVSSALLETFTRCWTPADGFYIEGHVGVLYADATSQKALNAKFVRPKPLLRKIAPPQQMQATSLATSFSNPLSLS